MAKEIDKIIQSKTAPKSNNVLWDDGENLKINRNGKWENANNTETNSLSIDPVVWKYMCSPYHITYGPKIPDDLLSVIFDDNGNLKDIITKLVVIDLTAEENDETYPASLPVVKIYDENVVVPMNMYMPKAVVIYSNGNTSGY